MSIPQNYEGTRCIHGNGSNSCSAVTIQRTLEPDHEEGVICTRSANDNNKIKVLNWYAPVLGDGFYDWVSFTGDEVLGDSHRFFFCHIFPGIMWIVVFIRLSWMHPPVAAGTLNT